MDTADVWMSDLPRNAYFGKQSRSVRWICGLCFWQKFDRYNLVKLEIERAIYLTHSAVAEEIQYAIAAREYSPKWKSSLAFRAKVCYRPLVPVSLGVRSLRIAQSPTRTAETHCVRYLRGARAAPWHASSLCPAALSEKLR